jgi:hypothetical protein
MQSYVRQKAEAAIPSWAWRSSHAPTEKEIATVVCFCEGDDATLDLPCEHLTADRFEALSAPGGGDALRLCRSTSLRGTTAV